MSNATFYDGREPEQVPAYSVGEVATYLQLPPATVRSWVFGMNYRQGGETRRFSPVIRAEDLKGKLLSFENLVEVHVLSSLRRNHKVELGAVRRAVAFLRKLHRTDHPLAVLDTVTDGTEVFVEHYGRLINASRDGQAAMRQIVEKYLTRIDRNPAGRSVRLFPVTRSGVDVADAPRLVAIDARYRFGRPFLVSCGVETRIIAGRIKAGDSVGEVSLDYGVSEDQIEEAIRYELPSAA